MKSLACFVTGIALIALVVPGAHIQYVMAQSGTKAKHYCQRVSLSVWVVPEDISCNTATGKCPSHQAYFLVLGNCVFGGDEYLGDCHYWMGEAYVSIPVRFVDQGHSAIWWGVNVGGLVICAIASIAIGFSPAGVLGAFVTAVVCGGAVLAVNSKINPCNAGYCEVDWNATPIGGTMGLKCTGGAP